MTPDDIRLILHRLDEQDKLLQEIKTHTEITNGRVSKLEIWQAKVDGVRMAINWPPPLVFSIAAGVVIYLLTR